MFLTLEGSFRSDKFTYWLNKFSDVSNLHGMKWHQNVKKHSLKVFWIGYILAVVVALPTMLIYKSVLFFTQVLTFDYDDSHASSMIPN